MRQLSVTVSILPDRRYSRRSRKDGHENRASAIAVKVTKPDDCLTFQIEKSAAVYFGEALAPLATHAQLYTSGRRRSSAARRARSAADRRKRCPLRRLGKSCGRAGIFAGGCSLAGVSRPGALDAAGMNAKRCVVEEGARGTYRRNACPGMRACRLGCNMHALADPRSPLHLAGAWLVRQ